MPEKKSGSCLKVLGILAAVGLAGLAVCGAVGVLLYINWDQTGLPSLADLRSEAAAHDSGAGATQDAGRDAAPGEVVASAPIQASAANYAQWTARTDVLVLVDYYADW